MNWCELCKSVFHNSYEKGCKYERVVLGQRLVPEQIIPAKVIPEHWVDIIDIRLKEAV